MPMLFLSHVACALRMSSSQGKKCQKGVKNAGGISHVSGLDGLYVTGREVTQKRIRRVCMSLVFVARYPLRVRTSANLCRNEAIMPFHPRGMPYRQSSRAHNVFQPCIPESSQITHPLSLAAGFGSKRREVDGLRPIDGRWAGRWAGPSHGTIVDENLGPRPSSSSFFSDFPAPESSPRLDITPVSSALSTWSCLLWTHFCRGTWPGSAADLFAAAAGSVAAAAAASRDAAEDDACPEGPGDSPGSW